MASPVSTAVLVDRGERGPEDGAVGEGVHTVAVGVGRPAHSDLGTPHCQLSQHNTDTGKPSNSASNFYVKVVFKIIKLEA